MSLPSPWTPGDFVNHDDAASTVAGDAGDSTCSGLPGGSGATSPAIAQDQEDHVQADGSTKAETSEFHAACAVLGLSTAPSASEAKTAFRVRAALLHPDVHQGAGSDRMDAANAAMQQLNAAYQLVLESLVAGDPNPTNVPQRRNGMTRRCTKCRGEYTANDARVECPNCGRGVRVRSRIPRSYSPGGSGAGRVVRYARRLRAQQRTEPLGRLSHIRLWHDVS